MTWPAACKAELNMGDLGRFLLRNAARFDAGKPTLCINPPADLPWRSLQKGTAHISLFTQDYAVLRSLRAAGADISFGAFPPLSAMRSGNILLTLPREKDSLRMWLHRCATMLPPDGVLWLAGENRAGIKSAGQYLEACFGQHAVLDTARHCVLFEAREAARCEPFDEHSYRCNWHVPTRGHELRLCSYPGMFAHGKLDPGTRLLLNHLAESEWSGSALDFGCGSGVIGIYLKSRRPALQLSMLDANALALSAANHSLELNGMIAEVIASDGFSDIDGRFDLVVSNPPFHRGHLTLRDMSSGLLAPVRNFLHPGGQLIMVANRHLPYRRWLDDLFGQHSVVAEDRRFLVLHAVQS